MKLLYKRVDILWDKNQPHDENNRVYPFISDNVYVSLNVRQSEYITINKYKDAYHTYMYDKLRLARFYDYDKVHYKICPITGLLLSPVDIQYKKEKLIEEIREFEGKFNNTFDETNNTFENNISRLIDDSSVLQSYKDVILFENYIKEITKKANSFGTISLTNKEFNKEYSYGYEIETASGFITRSLFHDLNIKAVFDGSISGYEYVTGVLYGDNGLRQLKKILNVLNNSTTVNRYCGLHVNISGFINNKNFIAALYTLCLKIENEIFSLFPEHRQVSVFCKKLPKIETTFEETLSTKSLINNTIIYLVQTVNGHERQGNYTVARYDRENNYRYCWVSIPSLLFNLLNQDGSVRKPGTIEFRIHESTLDYKSIKNWTMLLMAIVNYTEIHYLDIMKSEESITLNDIINKVCNKEQQQILLKYVNERKHENHMQISI